MLVFGMSACDPARTSARTEIGDGFDLHHDFRRRKRLHFYKHGSRKSPVNARQTSVFFLISTTQIVIFTRLSFRPDRR